MCYVRYMYSSLVLVSTPTLIILRYFHVFAITLFKYYGKLTHRHSIERYDVFG